MEDWLSEVERKGIHKGKDAESKLLKGGENEELSISVRKSLTSSSYWLNRGNCYWLDERD